MSLLNKDDVIRFAKEGLNLQSEEDNWYIETCLKLAIVEISKKFSTLFHNELTVTSDANGLISLPADTYKVISVQHGDREAQPLDMRDYNIYTGRDITYVNNIYANIKRYPDRLELRMVPKTAYTDVYILFQNMNNGIGNIPLEHFDAVVLGTRKWFLTTKRHTADKDMLKAIKEDFKAKMNELQMEENTNYANPRFKNYWEATWERNFNYSPADQTSDSYFA